MPTLSEERELAETAAEVRQGATRLARRLRAERSARELSLSKLSVLADLARQSPATAGSLATAENQRPQSLTRVFAELACDGLIVRTRSEQDRRQVLLEITEAGRAALRRDMSGRDAWLSAALAGLNATEREVLRLAGRLMDQLADSAPEEGIKVVARTGHPEPDSLSAPLPTQNGLWSRPSRI